jgi:hypothetical protein
MAVVLLDDRNGRDADDATVTKADGSLSGVEREKQKLASALIEFR